MNTTALVFTPLSPRVSAPISCVPFSFMLLTPLIGLTQVSLVLQDDAVLNGVSNSFAIFSSLPFVPHDLHGDATACDRLQVERTQKAVDVHGAYRVLDAVQPKPRLS